MAEFIYTMRKVRKAHGDKVILDDVTLSFLPGAKIGVVGPNAIIWRILGQVLHTFHFRYRTYALVELCCQLRVRSSMAD